VIAICLVQLLVLKEQLPSLDRDKLKTNLFMVTTNFTLAVSINRKKLSKVVVINNTCSMETITSNILIPNQQVTEVDLKD
jgi:hypothetical protein